LNTNGKFDKTFNGSGKQIQKISAPDLYPNSVALQKDGKIIVAGVSNNGRNNDFAVARFSTNGSKDKTFATTGNLRTDFGSSDDYANSLAIQADGKILVEGYAYTYSTQLPKPFLSLPATTLMEVLTILLTTMAN